MKPLIAVFVSLFFTINSLAQERIVGNYNHNFYYDLKPLKKINGIKWKHKTIGNGSYMLLVHNGVIYSGDDVGNLYAIDCDSGEGIWTFKAEGRFYNGPSIKDGSLYFGVHGGLMYSLDITTGKEIWRIKTGGSVCFPPVFNNGLGYAQSHDRNLYIFDLQNGTIRDTISGDYWMCGIPSIANNHIYYPDWGGNLYSYDLEAHENEWTFHTGSYSQRYTCPSISDSIAYFVASDSILHAIDLTNGDEIMSFKAADKIVRSPAIAGNLIAFTTYNSHFYVIDRNNGKVLWDYVSAGPNNSHPIIVADVVYFGSGNGTFYAFDIQSGKKLWEIKLETAINTPFFYENALYFTSGKYVYRID